MSSSSGTNPYDAPRADTSAPDLAEESAYKYESAARLVQWLAIMFYGMVVLEIAAIGCSFIEAVASPQLATVDTKDSGPALMFVVVLFALGRLLLVVWFIVTVVAFCKWIYRANCNARALGAERMHFTPGWCVGWFFIPIANLYKPYQATKEIYLASDPERSTNWKHGPTTPILGLWWGFWIASNVASNVETRLYIRAETELMMTISAWMGVVSGILGIAAALLALRVVRLIHARQQQKHQGSVTPHSFAGGF